MVRVRVVLERGRLLVDAQRALDRSIRHEERRTLRHRTNERRGEAVVKRQDAALGHGLARRVEISCVPGGRRPPGTASGFLLG